MSHVCWTSRVSVELSPEGRGEGPTFTHPYLRHLIETTSVESSSCQPPARWSAQRVAKWVATLTPPPLPNALLSALAPLTPPKVSVASASAVVKLPSGERDWDLTEHRYHDSCYAPPSRSLSPPPASLFPSLSLSCARTVIHAPSFLFYACALQARTGGRFFA